MAKKKATKNTTKKKGRSTADLVDKLRGKLGNLQGGGGRKFNWIKFDAGDNIFRLVEPTKGPLIVFYKRHRGSGPSGKFFAPVDLGWIASDEECLEEMLEREKLFEKDLELIATHGDPYNILWTALNTIGKADSFKKAGIGQKRSLTVIFSEGEFGILDMSMTFGEQLLELLAENGEAIISWDEGMPLKVVATGEGLKRRYSQPIPLISKAGPLEFENEEENPTTPNLYDVIESNVLSYPQKVKFLMRSHKALVEEAGLDIFDFGVTEEDLGTDFPFGANANSSNNAESEDEDDEEDED